MRARGRTETGTTNTRDDAAVKVQRGDIVIIAAADHRRHIVFDLVLIHSHIRALVKVDTSTAPREDVAAVRQTDAAEILVRHGCMGNDLNRVCIVTSVENGVRHFRSKCICFLPRLDFVWGRSIKKKLKRAASSNDKYTKGGDRNP
eukprot:Opistho-2@87909